MYKGYESSRMPSPEATSDSSAALQLEVMVPLKSSLGKEVTNSDQYSDVIQRIAEQLVLQSMTENEGRVYRSERAEYNEKLEQYRKDYLRAISGGLVVPRYPLKPGSVVAYEAKVARVVREMLEDARKHK